MLYLETFNNFDLLTFESNVGSFNNNKIIRLNQKDEVGDVIIETDDKCER